MPNQNDPPPPAWGEILRLELLFEESPRGEAFADLVRTSKWGHKIREAVLKPLIHRREPAAIEDAILFLEVSPRFPGSGYHKRALTAALKSANLTPQQVARLRQVVLDAAESPRIGPEFSEYARLAVRLADREFIWVIQTRQAEAAGWKKDRLERILRLWRVHGRG